MEHLDNTWMGSDLTEHVQNFNFIFKLFDVTGFHEDSSQNFHSSGMPFGQRKRVHLLLVLAFIDFTEISLSDLFKNSIVIPHLTLAPS
jgi:hypothetical protein